MPTGKVCCLHCYLASLYKRSLQTNSVFQLVCIRGDKCTSGTHDQWVRVRSIVYNLEKNYHERTQRSTTRHFCHCTQTHKHVLLMLLHMSQTSTCRRRVPHKSHLRSPTRHGGAHVEPSAAMLHTLGPLRPPRHPDARRPPTNRAMRASRAGSPLAHSQDSSIWNRGLGREAREEEGDHRRAEGRCLDRHRAPHPAHGKVVPRAQHGHARRGSAATSACARCDARCRAEERGGMGRLPAARLELDVDE